MEGELSSEVTGFIARHIVSVEELEVLLLLHNEPGRDWTIAEINARLRSQEASMKNGSTCSNRCDSWSDGSSLPFFTRLARIAGPDRGAGRRLSRTTHSRHRIHLFQTNENLLSFARAFEIEKANMIAAIVYCLCALTSWTCAVLLLRAYRVSRSRLLFWSGNAFCIFGVSNVLLFVNLIVVPTVDLCAPAQRCDPGGPRSPAVGIFWEKTA